MNEEKEKPDHPQLQVLQVHCEGGGVGRSSLYELRSVSWAFSLYLRLTVWLPATGLACVPVKMQKSVSTSCQWTERKESVFSADPGTLLPWINWITCHASPGLIPSFIRNWQRDAEEVGYECQFICSWQGFGASSGVNLFVQCPSDFSHFSNSRKAKTFSWLILIWISERDAITQQIIN